MNSFLVFMPGGCQTVTSKFAENYVLSDDVLWAVASDDATCLDVCKKLGIVGERDGVVVRIDEYYGRFDSGLWQKLEAWGRAT